MKSPHRIVALGLAGVQIADGVALVSSRRVPEFVFGVGANEPVAQALGRFTGVRQVIVGFGALRALQQHDADVEWVSAIAACEALDALVSLTSPGLRVRARVLSISAVGAAILGAVAARGLARERNEGAGSALG